MTEPDAILLDAEPLCEALREFGVLYRHGAGVPAALRDRVHAMIARPCERDVVEVQRVGDGMVALVGPEFAAILAELHAIRAAGRARRS